MKLRMKDIDALNKILQEERQLHGSSGWQDLQVTVEQVDEDIQKGNLISSLRVNLVYVVKKKDYNNKEFKRDHNTTIEILDCQEKQSIKCTRIVAKDPDDNA